ncbi:MAG: DUF945 domain-containing protein [Clostridiales bacterium]|jgi:hypothetical protein|nr:DUF945 domain-containing protein [Clostridiales bacterium]
MKTGIDITAMAEELIRQREAKADYMADTRVLEMERSGSGVVLHLLDQSRNDAIEPLIPNAIAHRQIGARLSIPAAYYDRMLENNPELLARNVNTWFNQEPETRMVRTLDGTARAFLSDRYRRIDNAEIFEAVYPLLAQIPDAQFESCQITDSKMYIKVVNPRLQANVAAGDTVQAGVMLSNSEVGHGSVLVQPLIFRLVCLNGMVVNDAATRKYHVGRTNEADENYMLFSDETRIADDRAFMLKIQDTVKAATDEVRFHKVVNLMREAAGAQVSSNDVPGVVRLASKDYGLTEAEGDGVLDHFIKSGNLSLYGLANAVTRHSQDVESYDRATRLEEIGYSVMTMGRARWNQLNNAAA